jgi:hypothetical protein
MGFARAPTTCYKKRGCRGGCQRVPTSLEHSKIVSGVGAVHFCERVPSGCQRVPTSTVRTNRTGAHDLSQNTRAPKLVPAGADFVVALINSSWRGPGAFVRAGAERVPRGCQHQ